MAVHQGDSTPAVRAVTRLLLNGERVDLAHLIIDGAAWFTTAQANAVLGYSDREAIYLLAKRRAAFLAGEQSTVKMLVDGRRGLHQVRVFTVRALRSMVEWGYEVSPEARARRFRLLDEFETVRGKKERAALRAKGLGRGAQDVLATAREQLARHHELASGELREAIGDALVAVEEHEQAVAVAELGAEAAARTVLGKRLVERQAKESGEEIDIDSVNYCDDIRDFIDSLPRHDAFADAWDNSFERYTFRYLCCCFAIVWAIKEYDAQKQPDAVAAEVQP